MNISHQQKQYQEAKQRKLLQSVHVGGVVQVVKFDPTKMTVDVQPLSKRLENGKFQSQPQILALPVAAVKGGGFLCRPWYQAGDAGVVVYMDHDIDRAVTEGAEAEPNTERTHAPEDAVFLGGIVPWSQPVGGYPELAYIIGTEDAAVTVSIKKDKVELKNKAVSILINEDNIEIHGKIDIYDGNVTLYGHDIRADTISLKQHVHGQVESGTGVSGLPE